MPTAGLPFATSVFSVDVDGVAPHCNPVTCVISGIRGSVSVIGGGEQVSGDIVLIRPGIEHKVVCTGSGLNAMYLDGLAWPFARTGGAALAQRLSGGIGDLALDAIFQNVEAQDELRRRLAIDAPPCSPQLATVIEDLASDPMSRMTQFELAERLQMERTGALRLFKAVTGQTFRRFKQWSGLQHAARQVASGELVRTAAMDAGFADTAHLTRTFRRSFGLTPSEAIAGLAKAAPGSPLPRH
ncbi:MAG: helix-turn-helix transcriptional regulator [Rhodospirillales bacterium]|nr:helix-turn-helix transcriptional regulator [Rhodospirillales bacterium]